MKNNEENFIDKWNSDGYIQRKIKNFEYIDQHFNIPFNNILDIGCGKAYESREFNKKYKSNLWLIEGNSTNNTDLATASKGKYHSSADEFLYYFPIDSVKKELDNLNTQNYTLLDCSNKIELSEDLKFDLITSYLSCGYHYPLSTYKELILKHSHKDTKLVFDIRNRKGALILEEGVEVVHEFYKHGGKYAMCQIKFKD
jgi:hypothetical protein